MTFFFSGQESYTIHLAWEELTSSAFIKIPSSGLLLHQGFQELRTRPIQGNSSLQHFCSQKLYENQLLLIGITWRLGGF